MVFGWVICVVLAVMFTLGSMGAVMVCARFGGKVGYEWMIPATPACILWWFTVICFPFTVTIG